MGRAPCCDKANVKRGPWSPEEDATLKTYVESHGTGGNWIALPRKAGLRRCGKSCRLRWLNYLRPDIKHGGFTEDEDNIIYRLYLQMGSRWSVIASQLQGRTDNDVKNYWNTKLRKKMFSGQISLANPTPRIISQGPIYQNDTAATIPLASSPSIVSPSPCLIPKVETHDSTFPNSQTQSSASSSLTDTTNPGLTPHGSQRLSPVDPYLYSPWFMGISEFGASTTSKINNSPINVKFSSNSQEGSSISDSSSLIHPGGNVCDEDGGILMDFGFGLPYFDIAYTTSLADSDITNLNAVIPQGFNDHSVTNYY